MRAVIHLNDYQPHKAEIVNEVHCAPNPDEAADARAVIDGVDVEWYPGGGNIHVIDDAAERVAELVDGSVLIGGENIHHKVGDSGLVAVHVE